MSADRDQDQSYQTRMRLILRWRRITTLFCVFLALYAASVVLRSPEPMPRGRVLLVQSLFAFAAAAVVAVNFLTFRLRRPRP